MSFTNILIALGITLVMGLAFRRQGRIYALMAVSVTALYWLQPAMEIKGYEIWFPTLVLGLIVLSWGLLSDSDERAKRENLFTELFLVLLVAGLELVSRIKVDWSWFNVSPLLFYPTVALALAVLFTWGLFYLPKAKPVSLGALIVLLLVIFVLIKLPAISDLFGVFIYKASKHLPGPQISPGFKFDLRWFGFSYIAFRLIHTLRDRQMGRLPQVSLAEYITYVVFFPTLAAGPIDRLERFIKDLRQPLALDSAGWLEAGQRIMIGLFKKFVIVDALGRFAPDNGNVHLIRTTGWMWFYVYAYAFLIYFDFSGYTDLAVGMGQLLGFKLPENFNAPYLKSNLTLFWNNWHMTLTQWFRVYFFNPLTRFLRGNKKLPIWVILLVTQVSTMTLIGLWHGIAWNFVLWGLWHGLGLFIQNRWSEWTRQPVTAWASTPLRLKVLNGLNLFVTFNFVALGWVFFVLPNTSLISFVFLMLFGFA